MKKTYRIRRIGKYYVVQEEQNLTVNKSFSLNPKKIFELMKRIEAEKMKESEQKINENEGQKYAQDLLSEPSEDEIQQSVKELGRSLWELTK